MRLLFLSYWLPYPIDNGSKLRVYGLLQGLAQHHEVTLLSFTNGEHVDSIPSELRTICEEVRLVPHKKFNPTGIRALFGLFSRTPRYVSDTFSPEMARCIQEAISSRTYDLAIASQLEAACYRPYFFNQKALFEEVEIGSFIEQIRVVRSPLRKFRNKLTWMKHQRYISGLIQDFQVCTVVSEQEKQLVAKIAPEYQQIEVIPNFINLHDYQIGDMNPQPNNLIFTGPFRYLANHDAMVWFLNEIFPIVQSQVPEVRLTITGDHANLPLPAASNVELTGSVVDVRPLIASSSVSLVPLRVGGGTRLKILEAMALGVPVVSTTKGAEGLDFTNGQHLLIGDTPEAFADQVIRLLKYPSMRQEIIEGARQQVADKYDWGVIIPRFESLVQRTANNQVSHSIGA